MISLESTMRTHAFPFRAYSYHTGVRQSRRDNRRRRRTAKRPVYSVQCHTETCVQDNGARQLHVKLWMYRRNIPLNNYALNQTECNYT